MDVLILVGRVMFSLLFVASAMGHLTQTTPMATYAESRGVPNAHLATQATGVVILLGAISVMFGIFADVGALLLFGFLVATAVMIHKFWDEPEGDARIVAQTQFMKDMALAGAALLMFAVFAESGDALRYALTGSLF